MIAPDRDSEAQWPIGARVKVLDEREGVAWRTLIGRRFAYRGGEHRVTHLWLDGLREWVAVERAKVVTHTESCATCASGDSK